MGRIGQGLSVIGLLAIGVFLLRDDLTFGPSSDAQTFLPRPFSICSRGPRTNCVIDGDTIWLNGEKMRFASIDTPEAGQRARCRRERTLAGEATQRLAELLSNEPLSIERTGRDRYDRTLVVVRVGSQDVGQRLVSEGHAQVYRGRDVMKWCRS